MKKKWSFHNHTSEVIYIHVIRGVVEGEDRLIINLYDKDNKPQLIIAGNLFPLTPNIERPYVIKLDKPMSYECIWHGRGARIRKRNTKDHWEIIFDYFHDSRN